MIRALIAVGLALVLLGGGIGGYMAMSAHGGHDNPEAESYAVSDDPMADVDAALARAGLNDKHVLLVMGANWCHDSRALAGWLQTERFAELIEREYELVFVNVGMPQSGDGHNLGLARRFGVDDLPGTPNVLVLSADGILLNADTVTTWRNAASRTEEEIFKELSQLAEQAG